MFCQKESAVHGVVCLVRDTSKQMQCMFCQRNMCLCCCRSCQWKHQKIRRGACFSSSFLYQNIVKKMSNNCHKFSQFWKQSWNIKNDNKNLPNSLEIQNTSKSEKGKGAGLCCADDSIALSPCSTCSTRPGSALRFRHVWYGLGLEKNTEKNYIKKHIFKTYVLNNKYKQIIKL